MRRFLKWLLAGFDPFNPPTPLGVLEAPTEPLPNPFAGYCELVHVTTPDNGLSWYGDLISPDGMYIREPLSWVEACYCVSAIEQGIPVSLKPLEGERNGA